VRVRGEVDRHRLIGMDRTVMRFHQLPRRLPASRRAAHRPRARPTARRDSSGSRSGGDPPSSEGGDGDPPSSARRFAHTDHELTPALAAVLADPTRDAHLWQKVAAWADAEIDEELGGCP